MVGFLDLPPEIIHEICYYLLAITPNPNSKYHPDYGYYDGPRFTLKPPSYYLRQHDKNTCVHNPADVDIHWPGHTDDEDEGGDDLTITNRQRRYHHPLIALKVTSKHLSSLVDSFSEHVLTSRQYGTPAINKTEVRNGDDKRASYVLLKMIWTQCTYCDKAITMGSKCMRDPILPLYNRHFRLCTKCDKERFPKITFTECQKVWKVDKSELQDWRNGIVSGYFHVSGVYARLALLEHVKSYVERRQKMRDAIGWKPRGKANSKLRVWEWESGLTERTNEPISEYDSYSEGSEEMQITIVRKRRRML